MTDDDSGLEPLEQTPLTLAEGEQDIRGWQVADSSGEEIGTVERLYVDPDERTVRFLQVRSGGVLGIGGEDHLVPVEAIDRPDEGAQIVRLGHDRERVAGSPAYDPQVVEDQAYLEGIYGWYGYPPYWGTGLPAVGGFLPPVGYPAYPIGAGERDRARAAAAGGPDDSARTRERR